MMLRSSTLLVFACFLWTLNLAGCGQSRTVDGGLGPAVPDAEPCGDGCPEGTSCVPGLDEEGNPAFLCIDVHNRYCAPCLEDSDCIDPLQPDAQSICLTQEDGSGSFCATDCTQHTDCPEGAYCSITGDRAVCLPEDGSCECSEWAIENEAMTQCSTSNTHGSCLGLRTCTEDGLTDCDAAIPEAEICNAADDNCDGDVDEVYPEAGQGCDGDDLDMCTDGQLSCDDGTLICVDDEASVSEVCNGLDDDCDGTEDNNLETVMAELQFGVCIDSEKICLGADGWTEPDYALIETYEEDEVTCDDLDNDCDGDVDERFLAEGEVTFTDLNGTEGLIKGDTCGVGLCMGGVVVCAEDGESLACSTADQSVIEICDGIDNDCDGEVDEGLTAPAADLIEGVCTGAVKICSGTVGWTEPDYTAITGYEAQELTCDGLDNDCDTDVDELYLAGGIINFQDADGSTLYLGDDCGVGACLGGTVTCGADGQSLSCSSHTEMSDEICDGLDNDCNGSSDDTLEAPAASLTVGVCVGQVKLCDGTNGWVDPAFTALSGFEASEVSCDGLDNDCDGFADNGLSVPVATNQAGVCAGASQVCDGVNGWQDPNYAVMTGYEAAEVTCDGLDNNCDGTADNDLVAPASLRQGGVCAGMVQVCGGADGWAEPDYTDVEGFEDVELTCDGLDNDCDGQPDDNLDAPLANLQDGVCALKRKVCDGASGWTEPDYTTIGTYEALEASCDGRDNDCDGDTDEELTAPQGLKQAGVCAGSVQVCMGPSGWAEPDYAAIDGFELEEVSCDDLDNDCDGDADELFLVGGFVSYTDLDGTAGLHKGQSCGAGECGGGTVVCGADTTSLTCSTLGDVAAESCDGLDNDCDGNADENLTPPLAANQDGVCSGTLKSCGGASGWLEPDYAAVADYEASETLCDGLDNDCDGESDDDLTAPGANNQNGVCAGTEKVCNGVNGWIEPDYNDVTGYESTETVCDGDDNDCDGETDEELSAPLADNQIGVCTGSLRVCGGVAGWVEPDYAADVSGFETDEASCDGADNDCDNSVDEDLTAPLADRQAGACLGAVKVCGAAAGWLEPDYSGQAAYEGLEVTCDGVDNDCDGSSDNGLNAPNADNQAGVCSGVEKVCTGASGWTEPDYNVVSGFEATEAACDGLDNDCDGSTDEALTAPLADQQHGVCENSVKVCSGASGWAEPDYTGIATYETQEVSCDDLDNDCDDSTDELFAAGGVATFTDLNGTSGLVKGDACGAGACASGTVVCADDASSLTCSTIVDNAVAETCDGVDNDCDGTVDDELTSPAGDKQSGVCAGSVKVCGGSAGWLEPTYTAIANYEVSEATCDGLDNDCSGVADDGFSAVAADKQDGVCVGQLKVCDGAGGWVEPAYTAVADYEAEELSCDGLDNDCDGTTDELYITGGSVTLTDLNGTAGLVKDDGCGVGACAGGSVVCGDDALSLACTTSGNAAADVCDSGDNDCDGSTDEDYDLQTEVANCGDCDTECSYDNAVPGCNAGSCELTACNTGYGNCDSSDANGCEIDITSSEDHCGVCNDACAPANATGQCSDSSCGIVSCNSGYEDCNSSVGDGCEINTEVDVSNCGGCDTVCAFSNATPACSSGTCVIDSCSNPYANCDANSTNGCEVNLNSDASNCGTCGIGCSNGHGSTSCVSATCAPVCDALWGSCDGNVINGCETSLATLSSCGGCGVVCDLANASESCGAGSCTLDSCNGGYANCDGVTSTGCEVNINTDTTNCGSCGNDCTNAHGTTTCSAGACVPTCDAGWSDCDGDPTNGCETNIYTVANCGGCGQVCDLANGSESCAAGTCTLTNCNTGYADCDTADANGCEIYTVSDSANCGACGTVCTNDHGGVLCSGSTCSPSCTSGYGDCDSDPNDGCETDLNTIYNCGSCGSACSGGNASWTCSGGGCAVATCSDGFCDLNTSSGDGCERDLDTAPSCNDYINAGSITGDDGGSIEIPSGLGGAWYRIEVVDGWSWWSDTVGLSVTLDVADGTDYDLHLYVDDPGNCTEAAASDSSFNGPGANDSVSASWTDWPGTTETKSVYVWVQYWRANSCGIWSLNFVGQS